MIEKARPLRGTQVRCRGEVQRRVEPGTPLRERCCEVNQRPLTVRDTRPTHHPRGRRERSVRPTWSSCRIGLVRPLPLPNQLEGDTQSRGHLHREPGQPFRLRGAPVQPGRGGGGSQRGATNAVIWLATRLPTNLVRSVHRLAPRTRWIALCGDEGKVRPPPRCAAAREAYVGRSGSFGAMRDATSSTPSCVTR